MDRCDIAVSYRALRAPGPDDDVPLVYKGFDTCREALCQLENVPTGWFDRTRIRGPEGTLALRALTSVAWWGALDLEMIIATERR